MGFISPKDIYLSRSPLAGLGNPSVQFVRISEGLAGTEETIEHMRRVAIEGAKDPAVILLARHIVSEVPSKDYVGEAKAVFDWMRAKIRYRLDPHTPPIVPGDDNYIADWVQTPQETLRTRQGDCDDQSVVVASFGMAAGHEVGFQTVSADRRTPDKASHVYPFWLIRTEAGQRALYMDTTSLRRPFGWRPVFPQSWNPTTYMVT